MIGSFHGNFQCKSNIKLLCSNKQQKQKLVVEDDSIHHINCDNHTGKDLKFSCLSDQIAGCLLCDGGRCRGKIYGQRNNHTHRFPTRNKLLYPVKYCCFSAFKRQVVLLMTIYSLQFYFLILSRSLVLTCRQAGARKDTLTCVSAHLPKYLHTCECAQRCVSLESMSVNRLTGYPAVSNVPRASQLEQIEFQGFCHSFPQIATFMS